MLSTKKITFSKAIILFFLLALVAVLLVVVFPTRSPRIVDQLLPISPIDPQIRLVFSELMDRKTVEESFKITPEVEGNFSWAGKMFVFTPNENFSFGTKYSLGFEGKVLSKRAGELTPWQSDFTTSGSAFFFIDEAGGLKRYDFEKDEIEEISDVDLVVKSFDYDASLKRLLFVAVDKNEFKSENPKFVIYQMDLEHKKIEKIEYFADNRDFVIHFAKWVPFENAILVARTKMVRNQGFEYPSPYEEDRELVIYDFDSDDVKQLKTGNALVYEFFPTPDGMHVMFIDDTGSLIVKDLANGEEAFLVSDFLNHFGFSEYGGYLLYTVLPNDGVFALGNDLVMKAQNGEEKLLLKGSKGIVDQPSLSPDEKKVAFKYFSELGDADVGTRYVLGIKDLDREDFDFFTSFDDGSVDSPQFSPDGNMVAFMFFESDEESAWLGYDENDRRFRSASVKVFDLQSKEVRDLGLKASVLEWEY